MNAVAFVLVALAVYRVAHMLALEDGPAWVFLRFRHFLQRRLVRRGRWIVEGLMCPLCLAFWLGWLGALLLPYPDWRWYAVNALALSSVTVILQKALYHG